jgi:hypothetical protein
MMRGGGRRRGGALGSGSAGGALAEGGAPEGGAAEGGAAEGGAAGGEMGTGGVTSAVLSGGKTGAPFAPVLGAIAVPVGGGNGGGSAATPVFTIDRPTPKATKLPYASSARARVRTDGTGHPDKGARSDDLQRMMQHPSP